ncbi:MarR family transcriptional regulator [uncultured Martelella sp.]|uniref:MarR family winged helix-turn-helix transcriptional regulator n=1 Tax=uncultured Martelella sp. TaxID=392331 RepID=UPI0029C83FA4|nr:MarR family transcriptional regulator [uncultured Martelella sp.]
MKNEISTDRLGFLLTDVTRLFRAAFERRIGQAGLGVTPGEARTLARTAARNGARQGEIAEELGIEPMTLSRYLDRLEKAGLIERRADPRDGRAKCIHTTGRADAVLATILQHSDELVAQVEEGLSGREKETLRGALKTMRGNFIRLSQE